MAPRGRPRKRNTRMDAAIDALKQYGFSEELIRGKANEFLKAYGGDEGWVFIEDSAYSQLLDACLEANEQLAKAEEVKLLENRPIEDQNDEEQAMTEDGLVSDALSEPMISEIVTTVQEFGNKEDTEAPLVSEGSIAHQEDARTPLLTEGSSAQQGAHNSPLVEHGYGWTGTGCNEISARVEATGNNRNCDRNPLVKTPSEKKPDISSRPMVPLLPPAKSVPKRRPCHGWIDSDDEDEEEEEDADSFKFSEPSPRLKLTGKLPADSYAGNNTKLHRRSRWDLRPEDP